MLFRRAIAPCAAIAVAFFATAAIRAAENKFEQTVVPFVAQFCGDCHTGSKPEKGLRLTDLQSAQSLIDDRSTWKKVLEKLRARTMPPKDVPRPTAEQYTAIVELLTDALADSASAVPHDPGHVTMRRLNRAEYNNTLRDLLGIDFHPADDFPADDVGYGFDNNGDVLSLPPLLLEKYLAAAEQAISLALAHDPAKSPAPQPYQQIMSADPAKLGRTEAARQIVRHFAERAFRRPIEDSQLDRLLHLFTAADRPDQSFETSLQPVLTAILVSPRFLFRIELDPQPDDPKSQRQLDQWELASRLSYFLWSSMPDDELFDLARRNQLRAQLPSQVDRMLRDPKSKALVKNFANQWLQTRRLDETFPDAKLYPQWNADLRNAMHQEALALFADIIAEDRSLLDFLAPQYTFLNEPLAAFYGIQGVQGNEFRRVDLPADSPRGGVITMAAVLAVTSNPDRTSPVKRGKWILENILGTPPPPPPPDVPELAEKHGGKPIATVREQMELHRSDPRCATCHLQMDPLGFGLENFDAIGAWRDRETSSATAEKKTPAAITSVKSAEPPRINASGTLPDGRTFNGPAELKKILLDQRDQFCHAFSQKMLTYALGRGTTQADDAVIDSIADAVARDNYKFSRLILEIVQSEPFQMRRGGNPQ